METIKCTVTDLYELRALILGFSVNDDKGNRQVIYPGFVYEKGISEGTKRIAHKAAKVINSELEQIDKQRQEISAFEPEGEKLSPEMLLIVRGQKEADLLKDEVELQVELLDFTKVENVSLSFDYVKLYEKLFKNY